MSRCLLIAICQAYNNSSSFLVQNAYKQKWIEAEVRYFKWLTVLSVMLEYLDVYLHGWIFCLAENFRI
jgi:hypothetical protein